MTKEKLDVYRTILLEKRKFVLNSIERLREIAQIKEDEADTSNKHKFHLADEGTDSMGREESFMFISRELVYLNRIETAIKAIELGTYGTCKICGNDIPDERLEAVPTADTCIGCKNATIHRFYMN